MDLISALIDDFWNLVALLSGWEPDPKLKSQLEVAAATVTILLGFITIVTVIRRYVTGRTISDADAKRIAEKLKHLAENRDDGTFGGVHDDIKALTAAVVALQREARSQDGPQINEALAKLETGDTEAAEQIFSGIAARKAKQGAAANKEAAAAHRHIGALAYLHDSRKALLNYQKAAELDPDDPETWNELGLLLKRVGALDEAVKAYEKVLALGNQLSGPKAKAWEAVATGNLGVIYRKRGDLDEAEAMLGKALELAEEVGNKGQQAAISGNLGLICQARGDLTQAVDMHRKALVLYVELGNKQGMADVCLNLVPIYETLGDLGKAEEMQRRALALHKDLSSNEGMAADYGNLGVICRKRGDLDEAEAMLRKALALNEELDRKEGMAIQYANLGNVYAQRYETAAACAHWLQARALFADIGMPHRVIQMDSSRDALDCPEG